MPDPAPITLDFDRDFLADQAHNLKLNYLPECYLPIGFTHEQYGYLTKDGFENRVDAFVDVIQKIQIDEIQRMLNKIKRTKTGKLPAGRIVPLASCPVAEYIKESNKTTWRYTQLVIETLPGNRARITLKQAAKSIKS